MIEKKDTPYRITDMINGKIEVEHVKEVQTAYELLTKMDDQMKIVRIRNNLNGRSQQF